MNGGGLQFHHGTYVSLFSQGKYFGRKLDFLCGEQVQNVLRSSLCHVFTIFHHLCLNGDAF